MMKKTMKRTMGAMITVLGFIGAVATTPTSTTFAYGDNSRR